MSSKKEGNTDEDEQIKQMVKEILNLKDSEKNPKDIILIDYVKYIFSNDLNEISQDISIIKKNKQSFKYVKNFIEIIYLIFRKEKTQRKLLYLKEVKQQEIGNEIFMLLSKLNKIIKKRNIHFDKKKLSEQIDFILFNLFQEFNNTLSGSLTFYFYSLKYILLPKINTNKLVLYYFLKKKYPIILDKFDYDDFCPNLTNNNCLNLIKLFFKNIANNNREILFIYAFLIFKYEFIFRDYINDINVDILKRSVEQTLTIVKKKTLNNKLIGDYVYSDFIFNLNNSLEGLQYEDENENENEINSGISDKNNTNKEYDEINSIEHLKDKIKSNSKYDVSCKPKNNFDNNCNNNIDKNNGYNNNNEKKSSIIPEKSAQLDQNKNFDDKLEEMKKKIKDLEIIINNLIEDKDKKEKEISDIKKKMNNLIEDKDKKEKEMLDIKKKMNSLESIVGSIQVRDNAKRFLKEFKFLLNAQDNKDIKSKKKKKWELIRERIEEYYKQFKNSSKYESFIEIVKKSEKTIQKGNNSAHKFELEIYENKANEFISKNNLKIVNMNKFCFLLEIGVSNDFLIDGYTFLEKYFNNDISRAILRSESIENFFE